MTIDRKKMGELFAKFAEMLEKDPAEVDRACERAADRVEEMVSRYDELSDSERHTLDVILPPVRFKFAFSSSALPSSSDDAAKPLMCPAEIAPREDR